MEPKVFAAVLTSDLVRGTEEEVQAYIERQVVTHNNPDIGYCLVEIKDTCMPLRGFQWGTGGVAA